MRIETFSAIVGGRQDGAIYGGYFFSLNNQGLCTVYKMEELEENREAEIFDEFTVDKNDIISPHSNSVMFGNEFYEDGDEFPLLYTNIYNNYASCDEKLKGVSLVYRVQKDENSFKTTLVQIIEIAFTESTLWQSSDEDARPYGNFVIDTENGIYYAFNMRDADNSTRYFAFDLPKVTDGEICEKYNVKRVVLTESDVKEYFDCEYHRFIQGASFRKGKIYSLEGFTRDENNPPAIRIIDVKTKKQELYKKLSELGTDVEPEMIDFDREKCYYTDHHGNMYKIFF